MMKESPIDTEARITNLLYALCFTDWLERAEYYRERLKERK